MVTPSEVVSAARAWCGVPFAHQGRSRFGVDCLGLLVMVAEDLQMMFGGQRASACDERAYGHSPDTKKLFNGLVHHLISIRPEHMNIGDILLLRVDGSAQHLAILSDYPATGAFGIIHAFAPARKVVEHHLSYDWHQHIAAVFRLPQLTQ